MWELCYGQIFGFPIDLAHCL